MPNPNYFYEKNIISSGFKVIAGIDEVGRGTLAGPVVVGLIILKINKELENSLIELGVNDSKKLSVKKRCSIYEELIKIAIDYSSGWATAKEIDNLGINESIQLCINRGISKLNIQPDHLLIDALNLNNSKIHQTSIIKGDSKSLSIAGASIIAKVERDKYMENLDKNYDVYDFKNNKGYGTKNHLSAIKKYGRSDLHRYSYKIKNTDKQE